ncbi:MBL fold metallo-hydrolase [Thermophagus sp. OGC60D27]|uniref:MBL fold metallo-hydrolase n=1 Tax=Thermophagus sp. OGC60D27 TaxID=3458415 RepID=UPI0040380910
MVEICALASGSNGNCYYIGNQKDAILVDAGISRRQILERMNRVRLDPFKVRAIFISHEHRDHFRGVRVLSKHLNIPVYMTAPTYENSWTPDRPSQYRRFVPGDIVDVGEMKVHTFSKQHDAADPCSFRIEQGGINVGVMTDIGKPCDNVIRHFSECHAVFLESNYDEDMLWSGPYPWHLKNRVASEHGHLSNHQAFELLENHRTDSLEVVYLSHLSAENNRPDIALEAFKDLSAACSVRLTNRYAPSEIYQIKNEMVAR